MHPLRASPQKGRGASGVNPQKGHKASGTYARKRWLELFGMVMFQRSDLEPCVRAPTPYGARQGAPSCVVAILVMCP